MPHINKREEIYQFIVNYIKKNNCSPSFREIGLGCNLNSPSTVHFHITELSREGRLIVDKTSTVAAEGKKGIRLPQFATIDTEELKSKLKEEIKSAAKGTTVETETILNIIDNVFEEEKKRRIAYGKKKDKIPDI